jgi:hypothetical protein
MISQQKLLEVIAEGLKNCKQAEVTINPADTDARSRAALEYNTLIQHFNMAMAAGNDQAELERVVQSLEKNLVVGPHRHWRELSTVKEE